MFLPFKFTVDEVISQGRTTSTNIELIKQWLRENVETCVPKILPDELIVQFLLSCENDIEFTTTTIKAHYQLKKDAPELHDNRYADSEDIKKILDMWTFVVLPARTKENYAVHYTRLDDSDYKKFDITSVLKSTLMLLDVTLDQNPPDGYITITDMGTVGLMHLTKIKLDTMKKHFAFLQEGLPMQLRAIHIMNSNFVMIKVFNLLKKFIKNDVFEKIHFHPPNLNLETFYEHVPQECLPKEFAGDLPSLKEISDDIKQQFKNRQEYWNREEELRKLYL